MKMEFNQKFDKRKRRLLVYCNRCSPYGSVFSYSTIVNGSKWLHLNRRRKNPHINNAAVCTEHRLNPT